LFLPAIEEKLEMGLSAQHIWQGLKSNYCLECGLRKRRSVIGQVKTGHDGTG
jgi:hypothetical protein